MTGWSSWVGVVLLPRSELLSPYAPKPISVGVVQQELSPVVFLQSTATSRSPGFHLRRRVLRKALIDVMLGEIVGTLPLPERHD